jgi:hypothetical protein
MGSEITPLQTGALISQGVGGVLGAAASGYGAYLQDKQNQAALAYQKERDALSDEERRRQMVMEMLDRNKQDQAYYAKQNVPAGIPTGQ